MIRRIVLLLLVSLSLAACGTDVSTLTVPDLPNATKVEGATTPQMDQVLNTWKAEVPGELVRQGIKQETIEQQIYQSSATLQEVQAHYQTLTTQGWIHSSRMPGLQENVLLDGYDHSQTATVVIGALDASKFGGTGSVVYVARGHK